MFVGGGRGLKVWGKGFKFARFLVRLNSVLSLGIQAMQGGVQTVPLLDILGFLVQIPSSIRTIQTSILKQG